MNKHFRNFLIAMLIAIGFQSLAPIVSVPFGVQSVSAAPAAQPPLPLEEGDEVIASGQTDPVAISAQASNGPSVQGASVVNAWLRFDMTRKKRVFASVMTSGSNAAFPIDARVWSDAQDNIDPAATNVPTDTKEFQVKNPNEERGRIILSMLPDVGDTPVHFRVESPAFPAGFLQYDSVYQGLDVSTQWVTVRPLEKDWDNDGDTEECSADRPWHNDIAIGTTAVWQDANGQEHRQSYPVHVDNSGAKEGTAPEIVYPDTGDPATPIYFEVVSGNSEADLANEELRHESTQGPRFNACAKKVEIQYQATGKYTIDCTQSFTVTGDISLPAGAVFAFENNGVGKLNPDEQSRIVKGTATWPDGHVENISVEVKRTDDCPSNPQTKVVVEPYCDVAYVTTYGFPGFDKLLGQVNGMDVTFVNASSDGDKVVYKARYASLNMIGKVTARVELEGKFYTGSNNVSCVKPNEPRTEVSSDKACLPGGGIDRWVRVRMVYWKPERTGMWVRNGVEGEIDALPVPEFPGVQVLIERIENVDGGDNIYHVPASVPPTQEVYAVFHGQQTSTGREVWASATAPALTFAEIVACSNKWVEARTWDCSAPQMRDQIAINVGGIGLPEGTVIRLFFADTDAEIFINESGEYLTNWSRIDPNQYGWAQFRAEFWYADGSHDVLFSNELRRDYAPCGDTPDEPKKPQDVPEICVRLANGQKAIVKVDAIPTDAELGENACGAAPYELPRTGDSNSLNIVWLALAALFLLAVGSWIRRHA